jgi:hypothetical protein
MDGSGARGLRNRTRQVRLKNVARHIIVYRREDEAFLRTSPANVQSPEFDSWAEECGRRLLFDAPLGGEGAIREFWSGPANSLGLQRIGSIYDGGFYESIRWRGTELDEVDRELDRLEESWHAGRIDPSDLAHLRERLEPLRTAIVVARDMNGVVAIT